MKDIAGTLSFGAIYTGWVKWLMIFLFVSSLALMIFASIIAFVLDSEMLIVGAISALFVIGKNFSWCYVVTHEGDLCGSYFCYAPK